MGRSGPTAPVLQNFLRRDSGVLLSLQHPLFAAGDSLRVRMAAAAASSSSAPVGVVMEKEKKRKRNGGGIEEEELWGYRHLPLLVGARSKESVEYVLQALWRTRSTGLDAADRAIFRDILRLPSDSHLDPLLVCLRMLIRRCVYGNIPRDEIQKLFPQEVLPELQRLLTLLLQKFQREWREDALKDQISLPRLKAMTWDMKENQDSSERAAIVGLKLQGDTQSLSGEREVKFQLAKDTLDTMLKSMYFIRDQMSNSVTIRNLIEDAQ
ncbi:COMM domain-containing protein 9-like isoform X2 [Ananas comosus]|uniref:COMM domain-containing protein 9-like isoform X2 n=1 Tax=Ananas comosus TaxID=4615 RepID=A0A6P5EVX5_ANACO|nr:COMM domain-containing protein 9-like isoform X2 [Ananas comosus]